MKPRILHPFYAEIFMLDAIATRAADTAPAPLAGGFDDDFDEIIVVEQNGQRQSARHESPPVLIPCQIEITTLEMLDQRHAGNVPDSDLVLVFAYKSLKCMGLIRPDTGEPYVRVNDRLGAIRDKCGCIVRAVRTPPGLYLTEIRPTFGISQRPDLYLATFQDREQGIR